MANGKTFYYRNGELYCDGVPVSDIVAKTGTPVYIYSKAHFLQQLKHLRETFAELRPSIFYASKANSNIHVIRCFSEAGCGVDVNSAGELYRAAKAGVPPSQMIFAGVGKTPEEITLALRKNVLLIKAESEEELTLINETARSMKRVARVALRVNPDVDPKTHPYISTGLANNKFGIPMREAKKLFLSKAFSSIRYTGVDMHIGSQILNIEPYIEASEKIAAFARSLCKAGVRLEHLDLGGGFGVPYRGDEFINLPRLAAELKNVFAGIKAELFFEPGRFLTANAGILTTRVLLNKKNGKNHFVVVDAAMNDLLRPALYGAHHGIMLMRNNRKPRITCDVVGSICESSDIIAKNVRLPRTVAGDTLAITSAGAYGMVMSSNYNARLRPPEVLVEGDSFRIIRKRERLSDLTALEEI